MRPCGEGSTSGASPGAGSVPSSNKASRRSRRALIPSAGARMSSRCSSPRTFTSCSGTSRWRRSWPKCWMKTPCLPRASRVRRDFCASSPNCSSAPQGRTRKEAPMKLSDVNLHNPDNFVREVPHEMFRVLRREAPVYFHPEPDGPGFWVLTKYEDVKWASRNPQIFSSWLGGTNIQDRDGEQLDRMRVLMLNMDPPKHRQFRNIVNKAFTPRMVKQLEPRVREMAKRIVDRVAAKGECDFVSEVAAHLPMEVICEMMGVPNEDRPHIYELTNKLIGFDDPEYQPSPQDAEMASVQMFVYASKLAEK